MKRWLGRLALLAGSSLFCFVVLEVAVRVSGYGVVGVREGNVVRHRVGEFQHEYVLNSIDLRDSEIEPKAPSEFRILAMGDSFTYGLGVAEPETFVRRTETALRARARDANAPTSVRVVNAGVGRGPTKQVEWLRRTGMGLEPDLVVLAYYIGNDPYDDLDWIEASGAGHEPEGTGGVIRSLLRKSAAVDWAWTRMVRVRAIDRMLFRFGLRRSDDALYRIEQPELEQRAWGYSLAAIEEIVVLLEKHGVRLLVLVIPTSDQVRYGQDIRGPGEDYRLPNRILGDFLTERGIPSVDLLPTMRDRDDRSRFYYDRDLHWTAEGHRFAADVLAQRVWELVPASSAGAAG